MTLLWALAAAPASQPSVDSKGLAEDDRNRNINHIAVAGSPAADGILHWRAFAVIGVDQSVVFDMTPRRDGRQGVLRVTSKDYESSATSLASHTIALRPTSPLTVGGWLEYLLGAKRDVFWFNERGSDCRHWVSTVITDLEKGGFAAAGTHDDLVREPMEFGSFDNPDAVRT